MSQLETALTYLEQCRDEMQRLWETVVRLETPSSDPAAVDKLASHLDTYCGALGMETELYRPEGAVRVFSQRPRSGSSPPSCCWDTWDTVHPAGSFPGGAWTVRDDAVYGPGVHDCKGGLVMALYVIRALLYAGYDRPPAAAGAGKRRGNGPHSLQPKGRGISPAARRRLRRGLHL